LPALPEIASELSEVFPDTPRANEAAFFKGARQNKQLRVWPPHTGWFASHVGWFHPFTAL